MAPKKDDVKVEAVETVETTEAPKEEAPKTEAPKADKKAKKAGKKKEYTVQCERLVFDKVYLKGSKIELSDEDLEKLGEGWVK